MSYVSVSILHARKGWTLESPEDAVCDAEVERQWGTEDAVSHVGLTWETGLPDCCPDCGHVWTPEEREELVRLLDRERQRDADTEALRAYYARRRYA